MKRTTAYFLSCITIVMLSCETTDLEDSRYERAKAVDSGEIVEVLDKKGIGMAYKETTWSTRIGRLKPFWHYSWNRDLKEEIPDNVGFIPMFWGSSSVTDAEVARIKGLVEAGLVKYVLGFNEPDLEGQADMSVDEAIELWPQLEKIGVPLGSPAPASPSSEWLEEFMEKAASRNLRVDYVCLHLYKTNDAQVFLDDVEEAYQKFNKPIWITEMAVVDNQAENIEDNQYTSSEILATMKVLLPSLYNDDRVFRFAWFSGTADSPNLPRLYSSVLYDEDDNLTELGIYYSKYKPNVLSGAGADPVVEIIEEVEGNLIENGTFESGELAPWAGFKNSVISASAQEPNTGNYLARIDPHDGSIYQVIEVEAGITYDLSFYHRWLSIPENTFNVVVRNEVGDQARIVEYPVPRADIWTLNTMDFTIPEGVTQVRLVFYKPQLDPLLPSFFLDDVVIKNP